MLSLHRALRSAARLRGHVPGKSITLFLITHDVKHKTFAWSSFTLSTERHFTIKKLGLRINKSNFSTQYVSPTSSPVGLGGLPRPRLGGLRREESRRRAARAPSQQ